MKTITKEFLERCRKAQHGAFTTLACSRCQSTQFHVMLCAKPDEAPRLIVCCAKCELLFPRMDIPLKVAG